MRNIQIVTLAPIMSGASWFAVIAGDTEPGLANVAPRLEGLCFRREVTLDGISDFKKGLPDEFLLTAETKNGCQLGARGGIERLPLIKQLLGWYGRLIVHRGVRNELEFGDECYLYHRQVQVC